MANHDREREDPIFDGGEDDEENEGSHLPVVIIIASLVLLAFGGVVWLAYNQGLARGRGDVPVRTASSQTAKSEDNGIKIFQQRAASNDEEEKAAAPVEQPKVNSPQPQPVPVATQRNPEPAPIGAPQSAPAPVAAPAPQTAKPVLRPTSAPPSAPAVTQPQVATRAPAQLGGLNAPASSGPVVQPPKAAPMKPEAAKAAPPRAAGGYLLQIGAFKSDAEARTAWKSYQSKHSTLLNGFGPDVLRVDLGEKGTWYRLRIASFSDKDAASALCDRLKAQGGACFLAK